MITKIYNKNPNQKQILQIVNCLENGGIVILPTDTVYAFGCSLYNAKAIEKIRSAKKDKKENNNFSLICYDLSHLSHFCKPLDNHIFKLLKSVLPGAFTFILEANNNVPKIFHTKKKTIGIRIPDNDITRLIAQELNHPIICSSLPLDEDEIAYSTDPELIHEKYKHLVDLVVDGGISGMELSTVIDCTTGNIEIIREGKGIL